MKTNKVCTDNKLFPADGERGGYVGGVWQWRPGIQVAEGSDGVAYAIGGKSHKVQWPVREWGWRARQSGLSGSRGAGLDGRGGHFGSGGGGGWNARQGSL